MHTPVYKKPRNGSLGGGRRRGGAQRRAHFIFFVERQHLQIRAQFFFDTEGSKKQAQIV